MDNNLTQKRIDFLAKDYSRGFIKYCGLQALKIKKGSFESQILIGENHRTQDNFIHAGLMATMALPWFLKITGYSLLNLKSIS